MFRYWSKNIILNRFNPFLSVVALVYKNKPVWCHLKTIVQVRPSNFRLCDSFRSSCRSTSKFTDLHDVPRAAYEGISQHISKTFETTLTLVKKKNDVRSQSWLIQARNSDYFLFGQQKKKICLLPVGRKKLVNVCSLRDVCERRVTKVTGCLKRMERAAGR